MFSYGDGAAVGQNDRGTVNFSTSMIMPPGGMGSRLIGMETAGLQPGTGCVIATFTRGAARQFGGFVLYYHAATSVTRQLSLGKPTGISPGPDFF